MRLHVRFEALMDQHLPLFSHQKPILDWLKQKKNMNYSPKHSDFIFVKDKTIPYSKSPKYHVKLITYIKVDNGFDFNISVVFKISTKLGGLGTKSQDLVIYFCLGEGEKLPQLHLRALQEQNETFMLKDETEQINNLTGKCIMEISKSKHLQCYKTNFELECGNLNDFHNDTNSPLHSISKVNRYLKT